MYNTILHQHAYNWYNTSILYVSLRDLPTKKAATQSDLFFIFGSYLFPVEGIIGTSSNNKSKEKTTLSLGRKKGNI